MNGDGHGSVPFWGNHAHDAKAGRTAHEATAILRDALRSRLWVRTGRWKRVWPVYYSNYFNFFNYFVFFTFFATWYSAHITL
jgi:hypothetical protein